MANQTTRFDEITFPRDSSFSRNLSQTPRFHGQNTFVISGKTCEVYIEQCLELAIRPVPCCAASHLIFCATSRLLSFPTHGSSYLSFTNEGEREMRENRKRKGNRSTDGPTARQHTHYLSNPLLSLRLHMCYSSGNCIRM